MNNKSSLAWDETEKGQFCDDYFEPIKIPIIKHVPWVKSLPIPPGIHNKVIDLIKQKIETGVYKLSYSSLASMVYSH